MYTLFCVQFFLCSVSTSSAILKAYQFADLVRMAVLLLRWCHCVTSIFYIEIECESLKLYMPVLINFVWLGSVVNDEGFFICRAKHAFARISAR
jgi:hypothetical protein